MTPEQEPAKAKQHDPEETPREKARRLVARWTKARADGERLYTARLSRHVRYLSDSDRSELLEHLEGRHQLLVERLRDQTDDVPEFGFSSELLDDEDYDGHG